MKGKGRLFLTLGVITILVVVFSQCMNQVQQPKANEDSVAGARSCKQCHAKIYEDYLLDPHMHTSSPVKGDHLVSGGNPVNNTFAFNKRLKVVIEKRKDGIYQVSYLDGKESTAKRFDLILGSGKNAHTYGSWNGTSLTQLPLSYFREIGGWANSPGFPLDQPKFVRKIDAKCLACHSSYIEYHKEQSGPLDIEEKLQRKSLIYGIDCERCHGPAGQHVEFHLNNPEVKQARYVLHYKSLTRQQKLDACGVCHSGANQYEFKSTFGFKMGERLTDYYARPSTGNSQAEPDVHGTQIQMLALSKCFIKSGNMECGTCHSPHQSRQAGLTLYSKKCLSCHATIRHSEKTLANAMVKTNCIDCHMPLQTSSLISFQQAGHKDTSPYKLHTHRIAVYK
jgi:hypothetical protein